MKREKEMKSQGTILVGSVCQKKKKKPKQKWQKPTLEDVSEKIMAQPYIRFT